MSKKCRTNIRNGKITFGNLGTSLNPGLLLGIMDMKSEREKEKKQEDIDARHLAKVSSKHA